MAALVASSAAARSRMASARSFSTLRRRWETRVRFASASTRPARSRLSSARGASSSVVSTKVLNEGTKSLRTSAVLDLTLHCGHLPPLPRFLRSSHSKMHAWPKQWPHARLEIWCGPPIAVGSRQMLHARASPGSPRGDDGGGATDEGAAVASGDRAGTSPTVAAVASTTSSSATTASSERAPAASAEASPGTPGDPSAVDAIVAPPPASATRTRPRVETCPPTSRPRVQNAASERATSSSRRLTKKNSACQNSAPPLARSSRAALFRATLVPALDNIIVFMDVLRGRLRMLQPFAPLFLTLRS